MAASTSLPDTELPMGTSVSAADSHSERTDLDAPAASAVHSAAPTQSDRDADQQTRDREEMEEPVTTGDTEHPEEAQPLADFLPTDADGRSVQKDDYEEYRRSLPPTVAALLVDGKESPANAAEVESRSHDSARV